MPSYHFFINHLLKHSRKYFILHKNAHRIALGNTIIMMSLHCGSFRCQTKTVNFHTPLDEGCLESVSTALLVRGRIHLNLKRPNTYKIRFVSTCQEFSIIFAIV